MKWKWPEMIVPHAPRWLRFFSLIYSTRNHPGEVSGPSVAWSESSSKTDQPKTWPKFWFSQVGTAWSIHECVVCIPLGMLSPFPANLFFLGFPVLFLVFFTQLGLLSLIGRWGKEFDEQSISVGDEGLVLTLIDSATNEVAAYALYAWNRIGRVELDGPLLRILTRRGWAMFEEVVPEDARRKLIGILPALEGKGIRVLAHETNQLYVNPE